MDEDLWALKTGLPWSTMIPKMCQKLGSFILWKYMFGVWGLMSLKWLVLSRILILNLERGWQWWAATCSGEWLATHNLRPMTAWEICRHGDLETECFSLSLFPSYLRMDAWVHISVSCLLNLLYPFVNHLLWFFKDNLFIYSWRERHDKAPPAPPPL